MSLVPVEIVAHKIYLIRDEKVILDRDLALLYGVETSQLNRQVRRNIERFPEDFMFQLTKDEFDNLICQFGTSSWGGARKLPLAFTEQGIAMLSGLLNSRTAIDVNIAIMRVFVKLRKYLADHEDIKAIIAEHDQKIDAIMGYIQSILELDEQPKKRIGFIKDE